MGTSNAEGVVLGLLRYRPQTLYELRGAIQKSAGFFYTASFGSLHPALRKLEQQGLVVPRNSVENGRSKKTYTITTKGIDVLRRWLQEDLGPGNTPDEPLLRLFFMAEIPLAERTSSLKRQIDHIAQEREELAELRRSYSFDDVREDLREPLFYRLATLEYGIARYDFEKRWYEDFLRQIQRGFEKSIRAKERHR